VNENVGMGCPLCHGKCKTLTSVGVLVEGVVRRRRLCKLCGHRFTTHEMVSKRGDIVVSKRDGNREIFKIEKLEKSLNLALSKRNITPERIERIANSIADTIDFGESKMSGRYRLVTSAYIGQMVMESLKELDPVAYVRYASIHRRFYCLEDYQKILDTLG
jgi:transcriptional repressor NrdR